MAEFSTGHLIAGRYCLEREIGSGGFGTVWLAIDSETEQHVAVKFLRTDDATMRRRFEIEARTLSQLRHPSCVRVLASGRLEGGADYLVMELAHGITLRDWLEAAPMSVPDVVAVARQVAEALDAAHRLGIVHRDLKPSNVMIARTELGLEAKVLDFGIAKLLGRDQPDITKTGEVLGTPGYMSPEQLRGQRDIGPPTDLYALGVLLFVMLERRPPFEGATALEVCMAHLAEVPPPVTNGPPELRALISRLLAKRPSERPGALHLLRVLGGRTSDEPGDIEDARTPAARYLLVGVLLAVVPSVLVVRSCTEDPAGERVSPVVRGPQALSAPAAREPPPAPPPDAGEPSLAHGCQRERPPVTGTLRRNLLDGIYQSPLLHYVPTSYNGTPTPLVVVLGHSRRKPEESLADLDVIDAAEKNGFIAIAPSYRGKPAWKEPSDHVAVLNAIDLVSDHLCVDPNRVYLLGDDWGAYAADQLACGHPERFAALATTGLRYVAAESSEYTEIKHCETPTPVPRLNIAANADREVPLQGGPPREGCGADGISRLSLAAHDALVRQTHGCEGAERAVYAEVEGGACVTWACRVPYVSCVRDGGRFWSTWGKKTFDCAGPPSKFDDAEVVYRFLTNTGARASVD